MAAKYSLMPNEVTIVKENRVAHGGAMAIYTDDLILTNLKLICVNKGIFGNTKTIFYYPLDQIQMYNGRPQVNMGKLSNGTACLEICMANGPTETFNFQESNKKTIKKWIDEINRLLIKDPEVYEAVFKSKNTAYDPDSLVGSFVEAGTGFLGALGFNTGNKDMTKNSMSNPDLVKVSKKCISCSAPLVGYKGKVVKCKYCDTEQIL